MADDKINSEADDQANAPASESEAGKASSADASGDPKTPDSGEDSVEEEMEIARKHVDPSRGDKIVDGGDRVSTDEGGNPQE